MREAINWQIKRFNELSLEELYQIMSLRSEVFVVEQNCVYQDLDHKDQIALHVCGFYNDKLVSYSRLFDAGVYFENPAIGRVIVSKIARNFSIGHDLMKKSISVISEFYGSESITISAQVYLTKFYEQHGFILVGDEYLEDGIPHIEMQKN